MSIKIDSYIIDTSIEEILDVLTLKTPYNFTKRKPANNYLMICCPFHKNGKEKHPSCGIVYVDDNEHVVGDYHCFTCGEVGDLLDFIAYCFSKSRDWAKDWLTQTFKTKLSTSSSFDLLPIDIDSKSTKTTQLSEKVLDSFIEFHPYMLERKLDLNICKKFKVRYDPKSHSIVFPVRDISGKLVMLTRRDVTSKKFVIDGNKEKPVYLLDYLAKNSIDTCIVAESQINALTCWSYGLPAVALIGTGSNKQYDILNKSPIRHYILCFDGDEAGRHGQERFLRNIRKDVLVDCVKMPEKKDINDLDKDTFYNLLESNNINTENLKEKILYSI